jgi:predicted HicB family RNase H-like nuclease
MRKKPYDGRFTARVPLELVELIEITAARLMTNCSEYTRRALVVQLAKDGVQIPPK